MTVEEAQALNEAIQLSLLEAESMNNNTRDHTVDTTEYSTVHSSMRADDDHGSIYNDPIDIADNKALHEGIRLSLSEPTPSIENSPPQSIMSMLTDNLMYSKSHDDQDHRGEPSVALEEHSPTSKEHSPTTKEYSPTIKEHSPTPKEHSVTTDEEHSELNSETLQSTTDPSIQYKRKSSTFSLKKTAAGIAHKCSSVLNSAWHSMDRKEKHHTSASDSKSNDNSSNTTAVIGVEDNSNIVVSASDTTPTPSHSSTMLEDTTTTSSPDSINKTTVTVTPIKRPVHETVDTVTTTITPTEPNQVDNINIPPPRKSITSTSPSAEIVIDSPSTASIISKHPAPIHHSNDSPQLTHLSPTQGRPHSAPVRYASPQNVPIRYVSPQQGRPPVPVAVAAPARYVSPAHLRPPASVAAPTRYVSPQKGLPPIPVPAPASRRYVSPSQLRPPASVATTGRYVSPQQRRPSSVLVPVRYASPRYMSPSQLRPPVPVPVSGRYGSPQQGSYDTTIPGAVAVPYPTPPYASPQQQQHRYMSPQQRLQ